MGLLFKTPDTKAIISLLNDQFSADRIDELHTDDTIRDWFGDAFDHPNRRKQLWQISSQLGIWPTLGDRGKGRWFTFLKGLPKRQNQNDALLAEDSIKGWISEVLNGLHAGTANTPTSIVFDATEVAQGTAATATKQDMGSVRMIVLATPRLVKSNKGDPTDDT
jgi:hypothetical protein